MTLTTHCQEAPLAISTGQLLIPIRYLTSIWLVCSNLSCQAPTSTGPVAKEIGVFRNTRALPDFFIFSIEVDKNFIKRGRSATPVNYLD